MQPMWQQPFSQVFFNAGIGAGALFGNQIMRHIGLEYIGFSGAALAVIALGMFVFFNLRYRNQNI